MACWAPGRWGRASPRLRPKPASRSSCTTPCPGRWSKARDRVGRLPGAAGGEGGSSRRRIATRRWVASEPQHHLEELAAAELVVEAIPEDLELKREAFRLLDAAASPRTLLATNTSSLSVARIASAAATPERVLGMHFFNPVPLMALVEVIAGTDDRRRRGRAWTGDRSSSSARNRWWPPTRRASSSTASRGRSTWRRCASSARAPRAWTRWMRAMRGIGFRMGPFELVDAIGLDVNFAVSNSVYEQAFFEPRYRPHPMQRALVDAGRLGRKSGGGFYEYTPEGARTAVWSGVEQRPDGPRVDHLGEELIAARILATIVNEAASAVADGVATPDADGHRHAPGHELSVRTAGVGRADRPGSRSPHPGRAATPRCRTGATAPCRCCGSWRSAAAASSATRDRGAAARPLSGSRVRHGRPAAGHRAALASGRDRALRAARRGVQLGRQDGGHRLQLQLYRRLLRGPPGVAA